MRKKIKEIAIVQSGIYAKTDQTGDVIYLQAKHFSNMGETAPSLHADLRMEGKIKNHILQDGDLLFAAKGSKNFTARYSKDIGFAVASSTFIVIRIKDDKQNSILPDYLKWFLNRPDTLSKLQSGAKGTGIPSISKSFIEQIKIDIPPVETQLNILKVQELRHKEESIKKQIEDLREIEIRSQLKKAAKK